jgi:hypothetical protein
MIKLSVMGARTEGSDLCETPPARRRESSRKRVEPHVTCLVDLDPILGSLLFINTLLVTLCPADHPPSLPTPSLIPLPSYCGGLADSVICSALDALLLHVVLCH